VSPSLDEINIPMRIRTLPLVFFYILFLENKYIFTFLFSFIHLDMAGDTIGGVDAVVGPENLDNLKGTAGGSGKFFFTSFFSLFLYNILYIFYYSTISFSMLNAAFWVLKI
jgi:hypothetical protein